MPLSAPSIENSPPHTAFPAMPAATRASSRRLPVWDVKFSLGLILLVIMVNLGLTLLLGLPASSSEQEPAVFKQPAANQQGADSMATNTREAKVFISGEDKRVLLRKLNSAPVTTPEKRPEEPGTYRAMGDAPALSLTTGASRPSSLEQE